jgi:hypothetical protein
VIEWVSGIYLPAAPNKRPINDRTGKSYIRQSCSLPVSPFSEFIGWQSTRPVVFDASVHYQHPLLTWDIGNLGHWQPATAARQQNFLQCHLVKQCIMLKPLLCCYMRARNRRTCVIACGSPTPLKSQLSFPMRSEFEGDANSMVGR